MNLEILPFFIEEVLELLSKWEENVLSLEKNFNQTTLNDLFRVAHNIKGSSKMVGLEDFGNFIHLIEDVINLIRDGLHPFTTHHVEFLLEAHVKILTWVEEIAKDPTHKEDTWDFVQKLNSLNEFAKNNISQKKKKTILISEDLTISNMDNILKNISISKEDNFSLEISSKKIDTSGVQFILSLKKTFPLVKLQIPPNIKETISILGIKDHDL